MVNEQIRCDNMECGCKVTSFQWFSPKLKTIYFESSKTASSSMRTSLQIPGNNLEVGEHPGKQYGKFEIMNCRDYFQNQVIYQQYFKFGFVRNPWDKMVSVWRFFVTRNPATIKRRVDIFTEFFGKPKAQVTFEEFIRSINIFKNHHWELQIRFIPESVDFVGRFEKIGDGVREIEKHIGIKLRMPKVNTTQHGHYRTYYTDELKDIVSEMYAPDIARFGYEF